MAKPKVKDANEAKLADTRPRVERIDPEDAPAGEAPPAEILTDDRWQWLADRDGWLDKKPPPRKYLLRCREGGVLGCGEVGVLTGAGAAGKTRAVTQLAVAVATGTSWLSVFEVARPGRVLLALAEEAEDDVRRLVYRAAHANLDKVQREALGRNLLPLPLKGEMVNLAKHEPYEEQLLETPFWKELTARLAAEDEWSLIVLDPAVSFAPAEAEKDNAIAQRWINLLARLANSTPGNPTVLQVHHTNKMSRRQLDNFGAVDTRGVSVLTDGPRWAAGLFPAARHVPMVGGKKKKGATKLVASTEHVCFRVTKVNHGIYPADVYLKRGEDGLLLHMTDAEVKKAGLSPPEPEDTDDATPRKLNGKTKPKGDAATVLEQGEAP